MAWDFDKFPELPTSAASLYYIESPHKQIFHDIRAKVVKVIDGDTIRVEWEKRDFDFPVRLLDIDAPELNAGGKESQEWLEGWLIDEEIDILIDEKNRVGKFGRLLGTVLLDGLNMNELSIAMGMSVPFGRREELEARIQ